MSITIVARLAMALITAGQQDVTLSMTVSEAFDIRGVVVDYEGRSVNDAMVIVYHERLCEPQGRRLLRPVAKLKTAADGRFELDRPIENWSWDQSYWIVAYKEPLALAWKAIGGNADVQLQLDRPQLLGGIVVDDANQPVAGACVRLCLKNETMAGHSAWVRGVFLPGDEPWQVTTTDNSGCFLFKNLPLDTTADFRIDVSGRVPIWTFEGLAEGERYRVGQTDLRIALPTLTCIEGQVIDEDTEAPVTGLAVIAQPHERSGRYYYNDPVPVDPNGCFSLKGLKPGAYVLRVTSIAGREQQWFDNAPVYTVEAGVPLRGVPLKVNRGATLEVRAHRASSNVTVDRAQMVARSDLYTHEFMTDANGYASIHLPADKYFLVGIKHGDVGYISDDNIPLQKGQVSREDLDFNLNIVHCSGTVVDPFGQLQPEAHITRCSHGDFKIANTEGTFEHVYYTTANQVRTNFIARDETKGLVGTSMFEDSDGDRHLTGKIQLAPGYTITGRVVDPNGSGVPGVCVKAMEGNNEYRHGTVATSATDSNGFYRIAAVPPLREEDSSYIVAAYALGYNGNSTEPVSLDGSVDEIVLLEPVVLKPANRTVSGIVVDADGDPVSNVVVETPRIHSGDAEQPHRRTLTDSQGRFSLQGLCHGPVEVCCLDPRVGCTHTIGGDRHVKIVLDQTLDFAKYLIGTRLPDWETLGISGLSDGIEGKAILVCLVDLQQRPSRHFLDQLRNRVERLSRRNIAIIAVPMSDVHFDYNTGLSMAQREGDASELRKTLGVQSLPWLVLTDRDRTVVAEGFTLASLESQLDKVR